VQKWAGSRD